MSGLRCGRDCEFNAAQIPDKLCLVWGQRMEQGGRWGEAAEGTHRLQGWGRSPPPRSKSSAEHIPAAWICCCSSFCSHKVGRTLLTSSNEEAQAAKVTLNLSCC